MDFEKQISEYYEKEKEVFDKLDKKSISDACNLLLDAYEREARIYVIGNGGSSSTASHIVVDLNKGVCLNLKKKFHFVCLTDNIPTIMAIGNDLSFDEVFSTQLEGEITSSDLLIAISGSGNSKNIIKGVEVAHKAGAKVLGLSGYSGGRLKEMSDYNIYAPINDMQLAEDVHMSVVHVFMQVLGKALGSYGVCK